MTKYIIRDTEPEPEEKPVEVYLEKGYGNRIRLVIGDWYVFDLHPDGTGYINGAIPKNNDAGLQVDDDGRIVLK